MAAKRIVKTSINWTAFAETVPKNETANFQMLKAKNDTYLRRIASQPDSLPKLDWNHYKNKINIPGLVDSFQKSYESMQIPYPTDQGLISKINEQEKEMKDNFAIFSENINKSVEEWKAKLAELEKQIPYSEMTMEEYWIARPEVAIDPVNFPTLYPHEETQMKYTRDLIESGKM